MSEETHWRHMTLAEFDVNKLDQYAFMTITANHWRAAIAKAISLKPELAEKYQTVEVAVVCCDRQQSMQLATLDNEIADLHISQTWWDTVQLFRREYLQAKASLGAHPKDSKLEYREQAMINSGKRGDIGTFRLLSFINIFHTTNF